MSVALVSFADKAFCAFIFDYQTTKFAPGKAPGEFSKIATQKMVVDGLSSLISAEERLEGLPWERSQ
ncbi:hypothetical protein ISM_06140 [Roseovarius nubinhibens ISM]|uniref:Uncharacterized protein n=1 Tax=Roseovarius nubinhibens (strain ATCC BAA-591 / DSM 15170 / ISM) TaxID=89187 RepID=A3SKH0_ROSNI|nr:hypothetical protein ISM_06140 [Roseovarius nubinhibens ISM]